MKPAKTEVPDASKVWCHHCSIRIAASEGRVVVRDKTYHQHCYAKLQSVRSKGK